MNEASDSDKMAMEPHPMTIGERRDAQLRVLENLIGLLTQQIAELTVNQHDSVRRAASFNARLDTVDVRMAAIAENVAQVRDIMDAVRSGIKFLGWLGKLVGWLGFGVKWVGGIAAAIAAILAVWHAIKTGSPFPGGK